MRRWPISVLLLVAAAPAWGREPRRIDVEIDAGDAGQAARQLLGPGADLQETSVRHSLTGTHVRYRTLALDGTPVMGAEAAVHFLGDGRGRRFHARLIDEGGRGLWSLVGRRRIGESAARDAAALAAGGTVRRAEAVAVPAGPYAARPAWRVLVDTQQPRRLLEVLVDADDGSVSVGRDLLLHAEGTGWVYRPNPVTSSGDRTLRDNGDNDSAALTAEREQVVLEGLDGTGLLHGEWVDVIGRNGRVSRPSLVFDFTRAQDEFEEVSAYFHVDRVQRQLQALGFAGAKAILPWSFQVKANNITEDNSFFDPGAASELEWFIITGSGGVDDAEDGDILAHEYGHAVMHDVIDGFGTSADAEAIGEGFADVQAYAIPTLSSKAAAIPRACIGAWDSVAYLPPAPCLRRVDGIKHYPEHVRLRREPHDDGEIFSGAVFAAFEEAGLTPAEGYRIAVESLYDYAPYVTFTAAAEALLEADRNLTGGENVVAFRRALTRHGLLADVTAPVQFDEADLESAAATFESPTLENSADGELVVDQPGAAALRVHFASLDFETGSACTDTLCDAVYLYDRDGKLYARLGGKQTDLDGPMIPGDRVTVRWVTNAERPSVGLVIDRVDWLGELPAPTPDAAPPPPPDARGPGGTGEPSGGCTCAAGSRPGAGDLLGLLLVGLVLARRRREDR